MLAYTTQAFLLIVCARSHRLASHVFTAKPVLIVPSVSIKIASNAHLRLKLCSVPRALKPSLEARAGSPATSVDLTLADAMPAFLNSLSGAVHLHKSVQPSHDAIRRHSLPSCMHTLYICCHALYHSTTACYIAAHNPGKSDYGCQLTEESATLPCTWGLGSVWWGI